MKLETERLLLREMTENDLDDLKEILMDGPTMYAYEGAFTEEETRGWLEGQFRRYRENGFGLWAVVLKETGEMIGDCGVTMQNINGDILPEIGYHIAKAHQRKGYAGEAARACRDWCFFNTPFNMIYSYMKKDNIPSSATARSNGMSLIKEFTDSEGEQSAAYCITRGEWLEMIE